VVQLSKGIDYGGPISTMSAQEPLCCIKRNGGSENERTIRHFKALAALKDAAAPHHQLQYLILLLTLQ
jgi:hypothetical protein